MPRWKRFRWRCRFRELLEKLKETIFVPLGEEDKEPITISEEEMLAMKLKDFDNKTFEEIGLELEVSRVKASELVRSARKKIVQAIIERRPLVIKTRFDSNCK